MHGARCYRSGCGLRSRVQIAPVANDDAFDATLPLGLADILDNEALIAVLVGSVLVLKESAGKILRDASVTLTRLSLEEAVFFNLGYVDAYFNHF